MISEDMGSITEWMSSTLQHSAPVPASVKQMLLQLREATVACYALSYILCQVKARTLVKC